ncbi:MAG: DNA polymerase III subunit beta [Candidatus Improbicoccus pseudotrichonymphae]|uniref:Beta sliding clamp n=1 Tax=Candidatus Improbicoccus pseudotrichonymphae TaxID=3033792 RepID=A0AA48HV35_9FIRM|nr:MAG: DNA polymerase III subunit beta [Candidatus Improbicoccus pseudotrichonymphae]
MKFKCKKEFLLGCLLNLQRSVSTRSENLSTEGLHINVCNDVIYIESYNSEYSVKTEIPAFDTENGEVVVPAKLFFDIVKCLSSSEVIEVKTKDDNSYNEIVIDGGESNFLLPGMDPQDFPKFPTLDAETPILIDSEIFSTLIKQTIFAASEDANKAVYTGVLIETKDSTITFVAIDGFRLALRRENINIEKDFKIIVPAKTLSEILKLITNEKIDVEVYICERYVFFRLKNYLIISKLISGNFIDYESVIPKESSLKAKINIRRFIESIERVSLVIDNRLKSPIKGVFGDDAALLLCSTANGQAKDKFAIESDGVFLEISFNNKYMLDALKNIDSDEVILKFSSSLKPIEIVPIQGNSFLFLILPVRTKE